MSAKRVLVIGAGPAGLAAAARLLERGQGQLKVTIIHHGHNLGGKAASTVDRKGRTVEHGWHMVVGFYDQLRRLIRFAGLDPDKVLTSMQGRSHVYETFDRRMHTLDSSKGRFRFSAGFLAYDGMPVGDRLNFARFMAQSYLRTFSPERLTQHDDICFSAWALQQGLRPQVTRYHLFRFLREAYFNYPEQISAYHVLQSLKLMSSSARAELFVARGGLSAAIWIPLAAEIARRGGVFQPFTLATGWRYDGQQLSGVEVGTPQRTKRHLEDGSTMKGPRVPIKAGSRRTLADFDYVVSTIPPAALQLMNHRDRQLWAMPSFKALRNLRSAVTLSMTVLLRRRYAPFPGPIFGLPPPLGVLVNMKPYWQAYVDNPGVGAALHFVGQEGGFERWSDQQIIQRTLTHLARVPALGDVKRAGILDIEFHRNRSPYQRLMLCEPGVQPFRPAGPRSPFKNLFFAGDWVQNPVDLICMEGAIQSGFAAADQLLGAVNDHA